MSPYLLEVAPKDGADIFPIIFFGIIFLLGLIRNIWFRRAVSKMCLVTPDKEYENNHHIPGIGYYHAASNRWYYHPWNEFRESRGYYWDGQWHPTPDQRQVRASHPTAKAAARVNEVWRTIGLGLSPKDWNSTVQREGFGTAFRRSEGS